MLKRVAMVFAVTGLLIACRPDFGSPIDKGDEKLESDDGESCSSKKLAPSDPDKFDKCACEAGGKARCVPKKDVPASFAKSLDGCDGDEGVCIPDKIVESGGKAPLTCKSKFGEGRCMNLCVPEVASSKDLLDRGEDDECDKDERCVPCVHPIKKKDTGVCNIGKTKACGKKGSGSDDEGEAGDSGSCPYTGEPLDVSGFEACKTGGRCVPEANVPAAKRANLDACGDGMLCAPEKSVKAMGNHLPATCEGPGGAEGRCLSRVIKDIDAKAGTLSQSTCDEGELCAPCFSPIDGSDTGACRSVSCDQPKQEAKKFASCCGGKGSCVPKTSVTDPERAENLGSEGCNETAEFCAPTEDVMRTTPRQRCTGDGLLGAYEGACVSNCLDMGIKGIFLSQGTCDSDHTCAPCVSPLSGEPTAACKQ